MLTSLFVDSGINFGRNDTFFTAGPENSDQDIGFVGDGSSDLLTNVILWALKVLPSVTGVVHHGKVVVVHANELVVLALHVGHFHVVGGWADVFKLFASKNIESDHVNLSVAVLPSLGGGHLNNLAWPVLNHNKTSFTQG